MIDLRPVEQDDKDRLRFWRNLPEVADYMNNTEVISEADHARWFDSMMADESHPYWIITLDGEPVGAANLSEMSERHRRCYWGFYLASPKVRGKGVGSFVEYWIIQYVFEEMGLDKLCGEVLSFNKNVLAMHEKFGFKQEGILRQHIHRPDGVHDLVTIGLLREEWAAIKPNVESRLRERGYLRTT